MPKVRFEEIPVPAVQVTGLSTAVAADPPPATSLPVIPNNGIQSTSVQGTLEELKTDIQTSNNKGFF